jgi:hypothetical protein
MFLSRTAARPACRRLCSSPAAAALTSSAALQQHRWCATAAAAAGGKAAESGSARFGADPTSKESLGGKMKKEAIKMLKMQLILTPIVFVFMIYMFPPVSKAEEAKMMAQYEGSAGWKT